MPALEWSEALKVNVEFIDDDHAEFVALLNVAAEADSDALPAAFDALLAHTIDHFAREEALMDRIAFFATGCHKDEHARVLAEARFFRNLLAGGNEAPARAYLRGDLPQWFIMHRATMDTVTAQFALQAA